MNTADHARSSRQEGLEARFGLRVAARLGERLDQTPPDIAERLRAGREQALERARLARRQARAAVAAAPAQVVLARGPVATLGDAPGWGVKFASFLPLLLLVAGFVMIDRVHDQAQIRAAADVDAALLADDLPPDAYVDPGFAEYLQNDQP